MEYDSGNMYGVSRPISNEERKSSRGYAPIWKDTGLDKLKFEKESYRTGWNRELHTQGLAITKNKDMDKS